MLETSLNQAFERIAQRLAPSAKLLSIQKLQGGISAEMTAVQLERADGSIQKVIVRRPGEAALKYNPNMARHEFKRLQLLGTLALSTQTPLFLDESGEILPTPYLVMEYIEGESVYEPSDLESFLTQCAAQLAAIHRVNAATTDLSLLAHQTDIFPETPRARPAVLDGEFDDHRIRAVLEAHQPIVRKNPDVLLHGDFWPGNILWRDGKLVAVIDWEDTQVGDPLYDFAISRMDILSLLGREAMERFSGYYEAQMPIDYSQIAYWDLNAALRILRISASDLTAWAEYFTPILKQEITAEMIRTRYQEFIAQAFAKLSAKA